MITRSWALEEELDLALTLRFCLPGSSASIRLSDDVAVYALHTPDGPATVTITLSSPRIEASASGRGAAAAIEAVPATLGLDDEPGHFAATRGVLGELQRRYRGLRLGSTGRVFDAALPAVLEQRVTTEEAKRSYRGIVKAFGEPAPGTAGVLLPPLPKLIATLSYGDLHPFGVERSRAEIVIEVARRASRLEEIVDMDRHDAERRLQAVRGVGAWTAASVMGSAWGDRDAVPLGDYHLPNLVSWTMAGEPRGTDERMTDLLEPFRPYRRRAVILLKLSGLHAPRYGPRSPRSTISQR